ncbi:MAG: hypothetical protein SPG10_06865 [Enterocloster clostridioformis]|nr:hypothetical protein [Enterocloster clostridioformis]
MLLVLCNTGCRRDTVEGAKVIRGSEAGELLPGTRASGLCDQWAGVVCEATVMDDTGPVCSFVKERDFGLRAVVSELGRAEGLCVKNS